MPPRLSCNSCAVILTSSAVVLSLSLTTEAFNKNAYDNLCSILAIVSWATLKSGNLPTCNTDTSVALPSIIPPFSLSANALALVVPLGATINNVFADADEPSTIAFVRPSNDIRSPKYSST